MSEAFMELLGLARCDIERYCDNNSIEFDNYNDYDSEEDY